MPPARPETFMVRLVSARAVTARVRELVFERVDGAPMRHQAGQWVALVLPVKDEKGRPLRRVYSIASMPEPGSPRFELIVTRVEGGAGSAWLHEIPPGTTVEAKGPQGFFVRPLEQAKPSLFIATGTGVAPIRAMIGEALRSGRTEPMWLLFGVRSLEEALYFDELTRLSREHPCLRLELTLSRPPPGWTGRTGYVQEHVPELWRALSSREPDALAWVCGVKKMLEAVREVLRVDLAVDRQHVRLESYD